MAKTSERTRSRHTMEAVALLGKFVRLARTEQKMTAQELAERAGISRGLLQRIEKGDPKCQLGAAFEVATILGIALFDNDSNALAGHTQRVDDKLALLPKAIHKSKVVVKDDF